MPWLKDNSHTPHIHSRIFLQQPLTWPISPVKCQWYIGAVSLPRISIFSPIHQWLCKLTIVLNCLLALPYGLLLGHSDSLEVCPGGGRGCLLDLLSCLRHCFFLFISLSVALPSDLQGIYASQTTARSQITLTTGTESLLVSLKSTSLLVWLHERKGNDDFLLYV